MTLPTQFHYILRCLINANPPDLFDTQFGTSIALIQNIEQVPFGRLLDFPFRDYMVHLSSNKRHSPAYRAFVLLFLVVSHLSRLHLERTICEDFSRLYSRFRGFNTHAPIDAL